MNYYIQFTEITLKTVVMEKLVETPFFFYQNRKPNPQVLVAALSVFKSQHSILLLVLFALERRFVKNYFFIYIILIFYIKNKF